MVYHVVYGHGQRVLVAQHDVAQRVADQNHVDTGLVYRACRMVVVGREHGQPPLPFLGPKIVCSFFHTYPKNIRITFTNMKHTGMQWYK